MEVKFNLDANTYAKLSQLAKERQIGIHGYITEILQIHISEVREKVRWQMNPLHYTARNEYDDVE